MNPGSFFAELKRRNVYKVAVAYVVAGWALAQGIAQVFPVFDIPNWVVRLIVLLIIIGLPIALVLAWMFELTPQGIKRTETADAMPESARQKKHTWIYVVVIGAGISIALFFLGRYTASRTIEDGRTGGPSLPQKSIAVLPFDNLSEEKGNAYFAEGIQDEILTRLAKVADLKVISRTSTQHFKSSPDNLPQIAKQLGVMNILEGSVQKSNDQVRVNVQLINAMTDAHLWADIYDRKLTDIFAVESDIAKTIADTLQAKLTGSEKISIAKNSNGESRSLRTLSQRQIFLEQTHGGTDLRKAIEYFNQAVSGIPEMPSHLCGSGRFYLLLSNYGAAAPKDSIPTSQRRREEGLGNSCQLGQPMRPLAYFPTTIFSLSTE